jgi:hypothetical protein
LSALPAHAQISNVDNSGLESIGGTAGFDTSADGDQLYTTVGSLIQFGLSLLGIICLFLVLYAGFLWMTAGGDDGKVDEAKTIMKNAVAGLIIIMSAYAISTFIFEQIATATSGT